MSGPTAAQNSLGAAQLQAYQTAQQMTAQEYSDQQAIYGPMAAQFQSIFSAGPGQQGFSPEEQQQLNSQVAEGTAENYGNAARAVGESEAATGNGTNPLPSGASTAVQGNIATSAAQEESAQESQVNAANFSQGHSDWEAAGQGLDAIAAGENPLGYESAETGSGSAAGTTQSQIASEDDSWLNAALGAAGGLAGAGASAYKTYSTG